MNINPLYYWQEYPIFEPYIAKLQQEVLVYYKEIYLKTPPNQLPPERNTFWNPIGDREHIQKYLPTLKITELMFGNIKEVAILTLDGNTTLHTDHTSGLNKGVKARMNWPILNCKNTTTAFFNIDDLVPFSTSKGGTKIWNDLLSLNPVTSVELKVPTILRISSPHKVFNRGNNPRMSITVSYEEDIVKYLQHNRNE